MDETYVRIKGQWKYLYRAVDKDGQTIDFLLTPHRERAAAEAFLYKAIRAHRLPEKITIDQSGSNTAAMTHYNKIHKTAIVIRQCKYLNSMVEQDQRAVKRIVRPRLGFISFWAACCTIAGMEAMPAIRKGQLQTPETESRTPAEQFYALAAEIIKSDHFTCPQLKFATESQGVNLQPGDAVLIRTGRMTVWPDAKKFVPNEPGITRESAAWLIDHGAVLLGADTMGVEKFPMAKESVHAYAFAERGVCLLELAWLEDLAKDKVYEFAFEILAIERVQRASSLPEWVPRFPSCRFALHSHPWYGSHRYVSSMAVITKCYRWRGRKEEHHGCEYRFDGRPSAGFFHVTQQLGQVGPHRSTGHAELYYSGEASARRRRGVRRTFGVALAAVSDTTHAG
jgi:putative transposase